MVAPSVIVTDYRGQTVGSGPSRVATLDGGTILDVLGTITPGGGDPARAVTSGVYGMSIRFRGQLFTIRQSTVSVGHILVLDEGGTGLFTTGITAKGARGHVLSTGVNGLGYGKWEIVQTDTQDYLCLWYNTSGTVPRCLRYNPDNGPNGTWTEHVSSGGVTGSPDSFVFDGIVYANFQNGGSGSNNHSFDPKTGTAIQITNPYTAARQPQTYFTLHGRFFRLGMQDATGTFARDIEELATGAWGATGVAHNHGHGTSGGANAVAIPLTSTKILIIGAGGSSTADGLKATLVQTVADNPLGALTLSDVTTPVIPATLRPTSAVGDPLHYKVGLVVDTQTIPGTPQFFVFFSPGPLAAVPTTLYQVTDETVEMVSLGLTGADSDFAFPLDFYGNGAYLNGIDGSTRLVTASPRGYAKGVTGLTVKVSAHGDPVVLAFHNASGPFTPGEPVTAPSGAFGTVIGEGAAEGLYVRAAGPIPFAADETITGTSSGNTADLNTVLNHGTVTGAGYEVGETVVGTIQGTGTITHVGIGGVGETLIKVELTSGPTQFLNGDVITQTTGANAGTFSTVSSAPTGQHGGTAVKKIRARYFASGANGKGVPTTGLCSMVPGSGVGGNVVIDGGGAGVDELQNVVADGAVGGDTPKSFEWDFVADGVNPFQVTNFQFAIDRS